eukprot:gene25291-33008_t
MDVTSLTLISIVDIRLSVANIVSCKTPELVFKILNGLTIATNSSYEDSFTCNRYIWSLKVCFNGFVALCIDCEDPCATDGCSEQNPHYLAPCQSTGGSCPKFENSMHRLLLNMRSDSDHTRVISAVVVRFPDQLQVFVDLLFNSKEGRALQCTAVDSKHDSNLSLQFIETLIQPHPGSVKVHGSSLSVNITQLSPSTNYRVFCSIQSVSGSVYWYQHSLVMYPNVYIPISNTGNSIALESKQSERLNQSVNKVWSMSSDMVNDLLLLSVRESTGIRTTNNSSAPENVSFLHTAPSFSMLEVLNISTNINHGIFATRSILTLMNSSTTEFLEMQTKGLYFDGFLKSLADLNIFVISFALVCISLVLASWLISRRVASSEIEKQIQLDKTKHSKEADAVDENNISRIYLASEALTTEQLGETVVEKKKTITSNVKPRVEPILWSRSSNDFDKPFNPNSFSKAPLGNGDRSSLFSLLHKLRSSSFTENFNGSDDSLPNDVKSMNSRSGHVDSASNSGSEYDHMYGCAPSSIVVATSNCSSSRSDDDVAVHNVIRSSFDGQATYSTNSNASPHEAELNRSYFSTAKLSGDE